MFGLMMFKEEFESLSAVLPIVHDEGDGDYNEQFLLLLTMEVKPCLPTSSCTVSPGRKSCNSASSWGFPKKMDKPRNSSWNGLEGV